MPASEVYISLDIEADGPIPGPYSMLSFGLAVCGTFDGKAFESPDPAERTFYAELKPISDDFVPSSLAVSGLDRDLLVAQGREPAEAMNAAAAWVTQVADGAWPVVVAYPLGFDWMWLYWYFMRFADAGSPFSFSRHLDMKTIYATKARTTVARSTKRHMPVELRSTRPHTHNALDDAIEQAELFQKLFRWEGRLADRALRPGAAEDLVDGLRRGLLRGVEPQAHVRGFGSEALIEQRDRPLVVSGLTPGHLAGRDDVGAGDEHDGEQRAFPDHGDHLGEMIADDDVLHHDAETRTEVLHAGGRRQLVPEAKLADRLVRRVRCHVGPAVDHHPAEQIAPHVDGAGEPFGQQLGDRRLTSRLDSGDENDRRWFVRCHS
jgi:hypothetical protein